MKSAPKIAIYALVDPRDGRERYIGKAKNADARLEKHLQEAKSGKRPVNAWIRKLGKLGLWPSVRVLRWVDVGRWEVEEKKEIANRRGDLFWSGGLLNLADGGAHIPVSQSVRKANAKKLNSHPNTALVRESNFRKFYSGPFAARNSLKRRLVAEKKAGRFEDRLQMEILAASVFYPLVWHKFARRILGDGRLTANQRTLFADALERGLARRGVAC